MTKSLKGIVTFVFTFLLLTGVLHAQQVFKTTSKSVISYLEYVPQDYNSNSNKYPVVIFLHGIGERGPNSTDLTTLQNGVTTVAKNGPPKHVKNGKQFPFILISPQLKNNYGTWPAWYVLEVINEVKTYLRIDERRIHVTGLSLGGGGAWVAAQEFPKLFASVSPVCGGYNSPSKACGIAAENLPVWAFHGDADPTVSFSKTVNMVNAINACSPTPNPKAKITIYPGVNHNSWDRAYAMDYTYHNPNLYEWIMSYTNTINAGNRIPIANAGSDKVSTATTFIITGTATDSDGTISNYAWTKISGPSCTLSNANTSALSLSGLTSGEYMFRMTVTDNSGNTDSDYVKLTVQTSAPVANAGADVAITLPVNSVSLIGSGTASDATISSYKWTHVSGPAVPVLTNSTSSTVSASGLNIVGNYVLQLEVKDSKGGIGKDQVTITVNGSAATEPVANVAPTVNAGKDVFLLLPASSTVLNGTASDSDGTIVSYTWKQVSGPLQATLSGTNTLKLSVSGMTKEGFYVFMLTVKDNAGATASDKIGVSVKNTTSASSFYKDGIAEYSSLVAEEQVVDLSLDNDPYWLDKQVMVYSETGARIYGGNWKPESYENVFGKEGLFLYTVTQNGKRVSSGKIFIAR